MSEAAAERNEAGEHAVTPLELFFDLVFVFAITQVTSLLSRDPTWLGVIRGAGARRRRASAPMWERARASSLSQ